MIAIYQIKNILGRIEELRVQLYVLTSGKQVLIDSEILALSRKLDALLNEYYRLIKF